MKITCPDCDTSYEIKAELVGPDGRNVKCARCGNRWFVAPLEPDDADYEAMAEALVADQQEEEAATGAASNELADEAGWGFDETEDNEDDQPDLQSSAPPAEADITAERGDAKTAGATDDDLAAFKAEEDAPPLDIESIARKTAVHVSREPTRFDKLRDAFEKFSYRYRLRRISGIAILVLALVSCGGIFVMRDDLVRSDPDLASFFELFGFEVNLRGLEFRDLRTFREVEDGTPVLVIEGTIQNITDRNVPIPAIRFSLRNEEHQEIYAWTLEPEVQNLESSANSRFRTRLAEPPANIADVQLRFMNRRAQQTAAQNP